MIFAQPDFSVEPTGASPSPSDLFLCFEKGRILLHAGDSGELSLPTLGQAQLCLPDDFIPFELAHTDGCVIFSPHPFSGMAVPEGNALQYHEMGVFRSLPYEKAAFIMTGVHLWNWYLGNRFCGRCGHENQPDSRERALCCPSCGKMLFPMIAPAVIVAITCGDRILLARNARSSFRHYALISGYVEVGETLEHALRREVKEETGLDLHSIRYIGDQPWGVSGSHMFAYHAEADDSQPLRIQKEELSDARWFHRSELEARTHTVSIAFELIERFRQGTL